MDHFLGSGNFGFFAAASSRFRSRDFRWFISFIVQLRSTWSNTCASSSASSTSSSFGGDTFSFSPSYNLGARGTSLGFRYSFLFLFVNHQWSADWSLFFDVLLWDLGDWQNINFWFFILALWTFLFVGLFLWNWFLLNCRIGLNSLSFWLLTFALVGHIRIFLHVLVLRIVLLELLMESTIGICFVVFELIHILVLRKIFIFIHVVNLDRIKLWRQNLSMSHFLQLLLKNILLRANLCLIGLRVRTLASWSLIRCIVPFHWFINVLAFIWRSLWPVLSLF